MPIIYAADNPLQLPVAKHAHPAPIRAVWRAGGDIVDMVDFGEMICYYIVPRDGYHRETTFAACIEIGFASLYLMRPLCPTTS